MMYLEYDKCPERTIKKTRVAYVIISSACTEYVRKFDEWNRSILVTWTLVFWRANYLKLSSRRCKVVFAGCHDGVIEQKVSANPLMRRNPDTSRPCCNGSPSTWVDRGSLGRDKNSYTCGTASSFTWTITVQTSRCPAKNTSLFQTFKLFEKEWKWFIV